MLMINKADSLIVLIVKMNFIYDIKLIKIPVILYSKNMSSYAKRIN